MHELVLTPQIGVKVLRALTSRWLCSLPSWLKLAMGLMCKYLI